MRTPTLARSADTSTVPGAGPTTTPRPPRPPRSSAAGPRGQWPWPDAPPRDRARAIAMPPANSTAATGSPIAAYVQPAVLEEFHLLRRGAAVELGVAAAVVESVGGWRRHRDGYREAQLTGHRMAVGRHDSVRNRVSAGIDQPLDGLHDDCLGDHRGAVLPVTSVCARDDDGDETSVYRLAEDELDRRGRSIEPCPVGGTARHERGVRVRRRADEDDERPEQPDSDDHGTGRPSHAATVGALVRTTQPESSRRRMRVRVLRARAVDPAGSRGAACPVEPLTARDDARMSGGARAS